MLFKVVTGKDVFELNPELRAIAEFEPLTDRQMKYVILSTDYKSPFRKLNPKDKKERAIIEAGYRMDSNGKQPDFNARKVITGKNEQVEKAIKKYRILQKDEDYETILSLGKLISDIRDFNGKQDKSASDIEKAIKFSKDLPTLLKAKREVEDILEMREEEVTDVEEVTNTDEEIKESSLAILALINEEDNTEA